MPPGSHINFQVEGLGSIVYELDMRRSRAFGLIPPFHLLNIPVDLSAQELDQYDRLSSDIATQMRTLAPLLSRSTDEFEDQTIFARLKRLYLDQEQESPLRKDIETLYRMLFTRASVYHLAESKREAVVRAIRLLLEFGKKTIVFYERIVSADETEAELSADEALRIHRAVTNGHSGFWCRVCHSLQTNSERQAVLAEFAEPGPKVLIACRSLDEGFDVPEVDAAILAASTQSTRQRIQRIGRVLRKFSEDKRAIILTLYVPGTGDARVVAGDREMFAGPTDMFECKAGTWERVLRQLLECYGRPADIASAQHEPRHRTSVPTPEGRT
jgi:superfamily II DNA or RNA helicase